MMLGTDIFVDEKRTGSARRTSEEDLKRLRLKF